MPPITEVVLTKCPEIRNLEMLYLFPQRSGENRFLVMIFLYYYKDERDYHTGASLVFV
jgi:hypothetical protein